MSPGVWELPRREQGPIASWSRCRLIWAQRPLVAAGACRGTPEA